MPSATWHAIWSTSQYVSTSHFNVFLILINGEFLDTWNQCVVRPWQRPFVQVALPICYPGREQPFLNICRAPPDTRLRARAKKSQQPISMYLQLRMPPPRLIHGYFFDPHQHWRHLVSLTIVATVHLLNPYFKLNAYYYNVSILHHH